MTAAASGKGPGWPGSGAGPCGRKRVWRGHGDPVFLDIHKRIHGGLEERALFRNGWAREPLPVLCGDSCLCLCSFDCGKTIWGFRASLPWRGARPVRGLLAAPRTRGRVAFALFTRPQLVLLSQAHGRMALPRSLPAPGLTLTPFESRSWAHTGRLKQQGLQV